MIDEINRIRTGSASELWRVRVNAGELDAGLRDGAIPNDGYKKCSVQARELTTSAGSWVLDIEGGVSEQLRVPLATPAAVSGATPHVRAIGIEGEAFVNVRTSTAEAGVEVELTILLYDRGT